MENSSAYEDYRRRCEELENVRKGEVQQTFFCDKNINNNISNNIDTNINSAINNTIYNDIDEDINNDMNNTTYGNIHNDDTLNTQTTINKNQNYPAGAYGNTNFQPRVSQKQINQTFKDFLLLGFAFPIFVFVKSLFSLTSANDVMKYGAYGDNVVVYSFPIAVCLTILITAILFFLRQTYKNEVERKGIYSTNDATVYGTSFFIGNGITCAIYSFFVHFVISKFPYKFSQITMGFVPLTPEESYLQETRLTENAANLRSIADHANMFEFFCIFLVAIALGTFLAFVIKDTYVGDSPKNNTSYKSSVGVYTIAFAIVIILNLFFIFYTGIPMADFSIVS